jgi:shikimate 5-dehydrogenase
MFYFPGFSLKKYMKDQLGMTADGSLSTALSNFVFEKLGLNSFMKAVPCDRSEPPYSINRLNYTGWSSGEYLVVIHSAKFFS